MHQNYSVPSCNTLLLWVRNCRETASAAKRKRPGREPSIRTPGNIERLLQAFVRSPPIAGMCWQKGTPPHRHYIQEVNILIKCFQIKIILVINSRNKTVHFWFYCDLKIVRVFWRTLYLKKTADDGNKSTFAKITLERSSSSSFQSAPGFDRLSCPPPFVSE